MHLEGEVVALDAIDRDARHVRDGEELGRRAVPRLPWPWGRRSGFLPDSHPDLAPQTVAAMQPFNLPSSVRFENTGSVRIEREVDELRPFRSHNTEHGESVLIVSDAELTEVEGTWTITARHNDH